MKLRIKFGKSGAMKFIGHLDIMRFFQKAIRRADIDIAYSTGFSPHQIMSFAAPLGVGIESTGEYFDIEVNTVTNCTDMLEALNNACVEGIVIYSIKRLPENVGNAMATVAASSYKIKWKEGYNRPIDLLSQIDSFCSKEHIFINKQTKKNITQIDLKPSIYELYSKNDELYMMVNSSSSGSIKPTLVLEALYQDLGIEFDPLSVQITRLDTFVNKGCAENPDFVPMDAVGVDF